jgi:hypothetical protein
MGRSIKNFPAPDLCRNAPKKMKSIFVQKCAKKDEKYHVCGQYIGHDTEDPVGSEEKGRAEALYPEPPVGNNIRKVRPEVSVAEHCYPDNGHSPPENPPAHLY